MRLDSLYYRLAYRLGRPAWDTSEPEPELNKLAVGRVPGRALDLGCGTGTDAIDLARRGWQVDLLIDIGCYHAIPAGLRESSAAEVAAVAAPGADLYIAGISTPRPIGSMGRLSRLVLVHMVRKSMIQTAVSG
ncbi:MAG TPA: hypothetical protein VET26_09670 [Candidatus Sulfotelmatobacter sp.]|nr:hypothetical protein [Candidatus Sulfotelmatobacter sp.]